jgi:hypothetical protein
MTSMASFAVLIAWLLAAPAQPPDTTAYLPPDCPAEGIQASGPAERFLGKGLFDYMDGGAERYLAYGFTEIGVRGYQKGASRATVEIYQMGGPDEAFGMYAFNSKGEHPEIGAPATLTHGTLSFHKDRYFVRVVAMSEPAAAKSLLISLAQKTAAALPGKPGLPAMLERLPEGFLEGSRRFLPNAECARTTWFDGEGDALLSSGATAVMALYPAGDAEIALTRAQYPSLAAATSACEALAKKLALPAAQGCNAAGKLPDDTFGVLSLDGTVLRWVSGAPDAETAKAWAAKIR